MKPAGFVQDRASKTDEAATPKPDLLLDLVAYALTSIRAYKQIFGNRCDNLKIAPSVRDSFALHGGRHHFFWSSSRLAAMSSICSASSFFSLAFSSYSAISRLASDTVIPEYFAFQA